jgi:anthranilate synthase component 1
MSARADVAGIAFRWRRQTMLVTRPLTPGIDLLALHRLAPARYPLLLESSAAGTAQGRGDLLLATSG